MSELSVSKLRQELEEFGESWFRKKYNYPFLVVFSGMDFLSKKKKRSNTTKTVDVKSMSESVKQIREQHQNKDFYTFVVKKTKHNVLEGRILIGRTSNNDIVLEHNAISRLHCAIVQTENGCAVVDYESSNGTYVNGTKLVANQDQEIENGDLLKVGAYTLKFFTTEGIVAFLTK